MTKLTFDILPQRTALLAGHNTELHALVRVQAPTLPAGHDWTRQVLNLSLVLDRSGSMSGQAMEEAKRCAACISSTSSRRQTARPWWCTTTRWTYWCRPPR